MTSSMAVEAVVEGRKKKNEMMKKNRRKNKLSSVESTRSEFQAKVLEDTDAKIVKLKGKSKKKAKDKQKGCLGEIQEKILERSEVDALDDVYQIPSGDEDSSKGMKKWVIEYHQSRPGLMVLQQRIDDFITEREAQQEQARKEREARLAEGGWTVVAHHKGRKKTTDAESGVTVGSVAQEVVLDKMAKKKTKEAFEFYRFQKREAQRSELMKLRSKFEDDKKRIQQLRAARKFRPY